MNSNRYRIIFSKAKSMFVVVSENTKSNGKCKSENIKDKKQEDGIDDFKNLWHVKLLVSSLSLLVGLSPVYAQIEADMSASRENRPIIGVGQNSQGQNIPVVNIQTPVDGVSHNVYKQFDVLQPGVVLNNSRQGAQSEIVGQVSANPFLQRGEARVIINEVNSNIASRFEGNLEVAGQRADVVIANPSGISVKGGGFINAHKAILTTGKPEFVNGKLTAFNVNNGQISIYSGENNKGLGGHSNNANYVDIYAKAIELNAELHANQDIKLIAGLNKISVDTDKVQSIKQNNNTQRYALDVKHLGGMYANNIYLIGTDKGLGVSNAGIIKANGNLVIRSDGKILNAGTLSNNDGLISINSLNKATIENNGIIQSKGNILLNSTGDLNLNKSSIKNEGQGQISLIAKDNIQLKDASKIEARGGNLSLSANNIKIEDKSRITSDQNTYLQAKSDIKVDNAEYIEGILSLNFSSDNKTSITRSTLASGQEGQIKITDAGLGILLPLSGIVKPNIRVQIKDEKNKIIAETTSNAEGRFAVDIRTKDQKVIIHAENNLGQPSQEAVHIKVGENSTLVSNTEIKKESKGLEISTKNALNFDSNKTDNLDLKLNTEKDLNFKQELASVNSFKNLQSSSTGNSEIIGNQLNASGSISISAGGRLNLDTHLKANDKVSLEAKKDQLNIFSGRSIFAVNDISAVAFENDLNGHHIHLNSEKGKISLFANGYLNLFSNLEHRPAKHDAVKIHAEKDIVLATIGHGNINLNGVFLSSRSGQVKAQSKQNITVSTNHIHAKNGIDINAGKDLKIDKTGLDSHGKEGIKLSAENRTRVTDSLLSAHHSGINIVDLNTEGTTQSKTVPPVINHAVRDNVTVFENNRIHGKTQFLDISTNSNLRYLNADTFHAPNLNLKIRSLGNILWQHNNKANHTYGVVDIHAKENLDVMGDHLHTNDSLILAGNGLNVGLNIRSNKNIRLQSDHHFLNIHSGKTLSAAHDIHAASLNSNINGHHIKLFADKGSIALIAKGYINLFDNLEHKHIKTDLVKVHAEKDVVIASTGHVDVNINAASVISRQGQIKLQSNQGKLHLSSVYTNSKNNLDLSSGRNIILDGVDLNSQQHINVNAQKNIFINTLAGHNDFPLFHSPLHSKLHAVGVLSLKSNNHIHAQNMRLFGGAVFVNAGESFNTPRNIIMNAYGSALLKNNPILRDINGKLSVRSGWTLHLNPDIHNLHALGDMEFVSRHGDVIFHGHEGHRGLGSERVMRLHSHEGAINVKGKNIRLEGTQLRANKGIKLISTDGNVAINGIKSHIPAMISTRRIDELNHRLFLLNRELNQSIAHMHNSPRYKTFMHEKNKIEADLVGLRQRLKSGGIHRSIRSAIRRTIRKRENSIISLNRTYSDLFHNSNRIKNQITEFQQDIGYFKGNVGGYEHLAANLNADHGNINIISSKGVSISGTNVGAHDGVVNIEARAPLNQVYKSTVKGRDGRPIFRKASIIIDGTQDFYDKGDKNAEHYSFKTFINPTVIHGTKGVNIRAVGSTSDDNLILQATGIRAPHGDVRIEANKNILFDSAVEQSFSREQKTYTRKRWGGMKRKRIVQNITSNDIDAASVDIQGRNVFIESKEKNPFNSIDIYSGKIVAYGGQVSIRSGGNLNFFTALESSEYKNDITRRSSFLGIKYNKSKTSSTRTVATELPSVLRADYIGTRSGYDTRLDGTEFHYLRGAHLEAGGRLALFPARQKITELFTKESNSVVWQSKQDKGSIVETAQLPTFNGTVKPVFEAAGGLVVQIPISEKDKNKVELRDEILKLSEQPGQEYLKELINRKDVDWNRVLLTHKEWDYKSQGLTAAGAALIAIIVAAVTAGAGAAAAGAMTKATAVLGSGLSGALGAGVGAAVTSLAAQASISLINNGGNIGKTLKDLGSKQALRSLATTIVTAGVMRGVGDALKLKPDSTVFSNRLLNNFTHAVGSTLINTGINGGSLEENLKQALLSGLASALHGELAIRIKSLSDVNYVAHKIAHAIAGCAVGALQKQCAAGAIGAAVGEIVAESMIPEGKSALDLTEEERNRIKNSSKLIAGSVSALAGYDVAVAANSANTAVENNSLAKLATTVGKIGYKVAQRLRKIADTDKPLTRQDVLDAFKKEGVDGVQGFIDSINTLINPTASWSDKALAAIDIVVGVDLKAGKQVNAVAIAKDKTVLNTNIARQNIAQQKFTIRQHYKHHQEAVDDFRNQLARNGYSFPKKNKEVSFGSSCGTGRCKPDIPAKNKHGKYEIFEIKTGNATLSIRQSEIYPQIRDGNAIPRGDVAAEFGLEVGIPLKNQGYPNGIPVTVIHLPGLK